MLRLHTLVGGRVHISPPRPAMPLPLPQSRPSILFFPRSHLPLHPHLLCNHLLRTETFPAGGRRGARKTRGVKEIGVMRSLAKVMKAINNCWGGRLCSGATYTLFGKLPGCSFHKPSPMLGEIRLSSSHPWCSCK